jgi:hypothetical protein
MIKKGREVNCEKKGNPEEKDKESNEIKAAEMQYSQLLEVHRSYFIVFLEVLALYLAVTGASANVVYKNMKKLGNPEVKDSKVVFVGMIGFGLVVSILFLIGVMLGRDDALLRNCHIKTVAKLLNIDAINTGLLEDLFYCMSIGTSVIIAGWLFVLCYGLCKSQRKDKRIGNVRPS